MNPRRLFLRSTLALAGCAGQVLAVESPLPAVPPPAVVPAATVSTAAASAAPAGSAAMPDAQAFEAAVQWARPLAATLGLTIRTDTLWLALLRARTPMLAQRVGDVCHIGYAAHVPGQDFRWLFPPLPAAQREAWLRGFVHHELAHCAEQSGRSERAAAVAALHGRGTQDAEVLADLAFARHADAQGPGGQALIEQLAALRAARAAQDPAHDTSAMLRCYLASPLRGRSDQAWLAHLQALRAACTAPTLP